MFAVTYSRALSGIEAPLVTIEVHLSRGLPSFSIVGLPVTRAAIEMAKLSAFPFGKDVVHIRELDAKEFSKMTAAIGTIGFIANVVWLVTFGAGLFLIYLFYVG